MAVSTSFFRLSLLSAVAVCQSLLPRPTLDYLFHLDSRVGDPIFSGGTAGLQAFVPILGGSFNGSSLSGKVLTVGGDAGTFDTNYTFVADSIYQLSTDDGTNILMRLTGPDQPDGKGFRHITFTTTKGKYFWLNHILAVGIDTLAGAGNNRTVALDAWQVVQG